VSAFAQTPGDGKQFTKDGLSFNYPSGWAFNDTSNPDAQQMTFGRTDSDAQITVFVFRAPLTSPEKIAEAKRVLVDKYVASTTKSFEQAGALGPHALQVLEGAVETGGRLRRRVHGTESLGGRVRCQACLTSGPMV